MHSSGARLVRELHLSWLNRWFDSKDAVEIFALLSSHDRVDQRIFLAKDAHHENHQQEKEKHRSAREITTLHVRRTSIRTLQGEATRSPADEMEWLVILRRYHFALPLAFVLLSISSFHRQQQKRSKRWKSVVGNLDNVRILLGLLGSVASALRKEWSWSLNDVSIATVLMATGLVYAEAINGMYETTMLRAAWTLIAASACFDAYLKSSTGDDALDGVPLAGLVSCSALLYVGFNAGARRVVRMRDATEDYERLEEADDEDAPVAKETPEDAAGPLSTLSFAWMSPLLAVGYSRQIQSEDLYPLVQSDQPETLAKRLRSNLDEKCANRRRKQTPEKALLGALCSTFGPYYLVGCLLKLVYDTAQLAMPLLLSAYLDALEHGGESDPKEQLRRYKLCVAIVATALFSTAILHQYFQRVYRTGMRLKSSAISLVFDKALVAKRVDSESIAQKRKAKNNNGGANNKKKSSGGKEEGEEEEDKTKSTSIVANLMSVDAQRLQDNMTYLCTIISGIYQIAASLYLLYLQLGYSTFAGFAVMLVFLPISQRVILMSRSAQRRVLTHKDARIKLQTEALSGMKIIKLYGWEHPLAEELKRLRRRELSALWTYKLVNVLSRVVFAVVPTAVSLCTFAMYVLLGNKLTVSRVYTSLALFNILRFPLMMVPRAIGSAVEAMLSVERIGAYLASDEVTPLEPCPSSVVSPLHDDPGSGPKVFASAASVAWPKAKETDESTTSSRSLLSRERSSSLESDYKEGEEKDAGDFDDATLLNNLSFDLTPGTLTAVVGETGSGKSGLLVSLLGETTVVSGSLGIKGTIAYAAQTAWIRNATLKENVLFGSPMNRSRYEDTIHRCALEQDLEELTDGDETEIGEKGLTLSGGQKQRVALARALYANADVYLLDDVLSAVDAHVASHLFDKLICHLRDIGKVVILITNNLSTLRRCDRVICLASQKIEYSGTPQGFVQMGIDDPETYRLAAKAADKFNSSSNLAALAAVEKKAMELANAAIGSEKPPTDPPEDDTARATTTHNATRLIAEEARQTGGVSKVSKRAYLAATGGLFAASIVVCAQLIYQVASVVASWWLGYWSAKPSLGTGLGLEVYAGLSIFAITLSCIAFGLMSLIGQRAAHKMHDDLLDGLLKAPMKFYDSTPLGRLVNLFSKDLYTIDEELPVTLSMWLTVGSVVLMTLITIAFATPWFLAACVPLGIIYYAVMVYFIPTVRELKRLDSTSRSPVFSSFAEALDGTTTIRAFRAETRFTAEVTDRLRSNLRAYFLGTVANRWLAVRLETLGTLITGASAFLAVASHTQPYLAGLALTYALSVTQALNWWIRMNADLENNSVAVERVVQYSNVETEIDGMLEAPSEAWPSRGHIEVKDLCLRYRPELPLVLKHLNFTVTAGTKLALVGRTGSGKSSFLLALLRIAPPASGSRILVDGIDIVQMKLAHLRSRVSMIPQDPVLFSGSIRFNVDPFSSKSDAQVMQSLEESQLGDKLARLGPNPLDAVVEEGGKNFSLGERQLLCLSRACLRHSKLLLLDEATSSIDESLDDAVQKTLTTKFAASTVICIAHRINTIINYDRVLVLDAGTIVEDGKPTDLAKNKDTRFAQMADAHEKGVGNDF